MQFSTRFLYCSVDEVDHLIQVLLENGLKSVFVIANCLLLFAFALGKHVTMNCLPAFSPEVKDRIYQMFREGEPLIAQARDFCLYVAHKLKNYSGLDRMRYHALPSNGLVSWRASICPASHAWIMLMQQC